MSAGNDEKDKIPTSLHQKSILFRTKSSMKKVLKEKEAPMLLRITRRFQFQRKKDKFSVEIHYSIDYHNFCNKILFLSGVPSPLV